MVFIIISVADNIQTESNTRVNLIQNLTHLNFIKSTLSNEKDGRTNCKRNLIIRNEFLKTVSLNVSYVPNPNELRYAHTPNNIRCYTTHPTDIRP